METPPIIALGKSLFVFFISPEIAPTAVHPSKANSTATISCPTALTGFTPSPSKGEKAG